MDPTIVPLLDERVTHAIAQIAREQSAIVSVAGVTRIDDTLTLVLEFWARSVDDTPSGKGAF